MSTVIATPAAIYPLRTKPPLHGEALQAAINTTPPIRPALIEALVLQKSVTMIAAAPGQGKSTLILTILAQACAGLNVFGTLAVPRPLRVYVFCPERDATELYERLHTIQQFIPIDVNNLCIDDGMTGTVDIASLGCINEIKRSVRTAFPQGVDLFCVEGMYGMTRLPMADEKTANLFYRFNAEMIREFGCSLWYSNHTKKVQHARDGEALATSYFGSQFIMANVTGAYIFERTGEGRSRIYQQKDTVSGLANEMKFKFDAERFVLEMDYGEGGVPAKERLRQFINACCATKKTFTYEEVARLTNLSRSGVMSLLAAHVASGAVINTNPKGVKALYHATKLV